MTAKILTGTYGTLTDAYTYNTLDQLSEYTGYDGYRQKYTYDANGMRLSKETYGNSNRSTLEELLRGDIAGLPVVIRPGMQEDNSTDEYEWVTEEYLYDITQEYYQVIAKTEKTANGEKTTAYAYGLERIAAYEPNQRTTYVYDGRGSVAKTISTLKVGETQEQNFLYTAFGEQMSMQKVSGFGYNAEAYDAATGMINLRARQYEPAMGRFEQKDVKRGNAIDSLSLNRYGYCINNAMMFIDPMGEEIDYDSLSEIYEIAEKAILYSESEDISLSKRVNELCKAYDQMLKCINESEFVPADLVRMMEEAKRAIDKVNNDQNLKPSVKSMLNYQNHIDACELAIIFIEGGFDEEDTIGRQYLNERFTRKGKQKNWNKNSFTSGKAKDNELLTPYDISAGAKSIYDNNWKYPKDRIMKPGYVACDSVTRVLAKLHFTKNGYKVHEKHGNLKTKPELVMTANGKLTKTIERGDIFDENGLTEQAKQYMVEGTVAIRLDVPNVENHMGPVTRRDTTKNDEIVITITHSANKKENMKIDYVNLTTQKQYFKPEYEKKNKIVQRQNTTWNKFSELTYVKYPE